MKKVILTGANGFIGSALIKELSNNNIYVYAIIKNENSNVEHIKNLPNVELVYCDLENIYQLPELIAARDIDTCIHLAWAGSFGNERSDYNLQLKNVRYSLDVVNVMKRLGITRFVGAGTLAEKDVQNYHPTDGATPNAVSMYGIAKISAHYMTKTECTKLGIEHIWCYLSNTYGIGNTTNNFVNMASRLMLNGKRAAFTSGEQTYDFVYIDDTVRAIYFAAEKGHANTSYYLGSTKERKLKEYITTIRDTIDKDIPLYLGEIPFNGNPLPAEAYNTRKLIEDTGYFPTVDFNDGIKLTVEWLKTI